MTEETHVYCAHCKRYLGTGSFSRCRYCGTVFNTSEKLGTITRPIVKTKLNTKLLKYSIIATIGSGSLICATSATCSLFSREWAEFFGSLATSLSWQFIITVIVFSVLFSVLRGLLWQKIDHFLLARDNWTVYNFFQWMRRFVTPILDHRRIGTIFLLIIASITALPVLAWKFNRPLDGFDLGFSIVTNILGGLFILLIEDLIAQKERINREKNWMPPPTLDAWERMAKGKER